MTCDKGEGYTKLVLEEQEWEEFKDDDGFFNPHLLSRFFKKLVNTSLSNAELPKGLVIQRETQENWNETWWPIASMLLGNSDEQESSGAKYATETHGPATTFYIKWQGGDSYRKLRVSLDLTLTLDFQLSKLPSPLSKLAQDKDPVLLQKCGFHVVPAGFDSWRISFSLAEKEILASSPHGFKECYRILKVVRDDISERLGWNPSLIPSYMLKTLLLSELFTTDRHLWEKKYWSERIVQVLELALEGVKREKIPSFFIPTHNLLTVSDHDNKLRQCVLEDMLNRVKGSDLVPYAREKESEVEEKKQQILVLKMIDLLDFLISSLLAGKNSTAVMKKMFVNIANFPVSPNTRWFWAPFTDFATLELDERAYKRLIQIWSWVEVFFKRLLASLEGEVKLLAQKLYIRTCQRKKRFESDKGLLEQQVEQMSPHEVLFEWLEDAVDTYFEEENSTLPNLRKAVPSELTKSSFFPDVADVTLKEGSDKGLVDLKQHLRKYLFMAPESYIINTFVEYVSQFFSNSEEVWRQKLDFIKIPELDLD